MKNVLWFSRHEMTEDQKAALGPDVEITQIDRSINNAYEIQDEIKAADVVAVVAPINLQQQFVKIADGKPVITALQQRELVPQENGESKVVFHFDKWEQVKSIDIVKDDYEPEATEAPQKVLWFSRHDMTEDQKAALGDNVEITKIDRSINSAYELQDEIKAADVVAVVAPINLQQQFVKLACDKPVITALQQRELIQQENGESQVVFHFAKWEQVKNIEVVKEDYVPEPVRVQSQGDDAR